MRKVSRHHTTSCALIVSLLAAPLCGTVHATEPGGAPADSRPAILLSSPSALSRFVTPAAIDSLDRPHETVRPIGVNASHEEQRGYGYRRGRGRRGAAAAALMIGAAAAITGTALLVYANRPECSTNVAASGCGYGTKVVGGSVLAGGVIGVAVGAALW
ncbi:MAG TPA: hypothetical protein VKD69_24070 [Vicinamibacterales bacterium]|nr:hypothetical protein [Vicinamibacterales bacterium]